MSNTIRSATIEEIVAHARDWESYADLHPDHPHTGEWAQALVRELLAAADDE